MSFTVNKDVLVSGLFKQGDIRDPIGIWGGSVTINGDVTGGFLRVIFQVDPDDGWVSGIFAHYSVSVIQTIGALLTGAGSAVIFRINTNWPNILQDPGIIPYNFTRSFQLTGAAGLSPIAATEQPMVTSQERFLLSWDPRHITPQNLLLDQIEILNPGAGISINFTAYGYFWDRSVLDAPGGPRHPGSS